MSDAPIIGSSDKWGLCDKCMQTLVSVKEIYAASIPGEWGRWIDLAFWDAQEWEECRKSCLFCAVLFNIVLTRGDDALSEMKKATGPLTISLINIHNFLDGRRCWLRLGYRGGDDSLQFVAATDICVQNVQSEGSIQSTCYVENSHDRDGRHWRRCCTLQGVTTWSSETKLVARNWLESSLSRARPLDPAPLRLLEIGQSAGRTVTDSNSACLAIPVDVHVRLCGSSAITGEVRYVTLSHTSGQHPTTPWGRHPAMTLTAENIADFHSHVPILQSPSPEAQVFKDAVKVAVDLRFRYLWIDALCINQDYREERSHEISVMYEIYRNADLNISAASATSGAGGLIFHRDPVLLSPFIVPELELCETFFNRYESTAVQAVSNHNATASRQQQSSTISAQPYSACLYRLRKSITRTSTRSTQAP